MPVLPSKELPPPSITEKQVKARVKHLLKKHEAYWFMPVQTGYGTPGLDFHGCHKGRAFAIETKRPGKTITPRQKITIEDMRASGMKVIIVGERMYDEPARLSGLADLEAWLLGLI